MAGSMIVIIPILILYIFAQRFFIEGIASSGVKG
jgi:multiple sugar transport system permease protein